MMTWFAFYANLVMSWQACVTRAHMHGTHALSDMGASNYLSGLVCMQADMNLVKISASHFQVLPVVLSTRYTSVPPKTLSKGISEPRKTHIGPFCIVLVYFSHIP